MNCLYLLEGENASRLLKKGLAILKHQVTKNDADHQFKVLNQYFYLSKNGFLVQDLTDVMCLFDLIRLKTLTNPGFCTPLNSLLCICSFPPILSKESDLICYSLDIQEYFSWLGYLLTLLNKSQYQHYITKAVYNMLTKSYKEKFYLSLEVRLQKAESSQLANVIGDLLTKMDLDFYDELLDIIEILANESKTVSEVLLRNNVVSSIIVRLEPTWASRFPSVKPRMPTGIEEIHKSKTIFNILIHLITQADITLMRAPSKFTLWSLQWAFRVFTMKKSCSLDRNNVLAVLILLMDIYPDLLLGDLSFAYDIVMLAMSRDIHFHPNWTTHIQLTTSNVDHSCMTLLLTCISYFPSFLTGPKVLEECRIVMGLLKLISRQQVIPWRPLQASALIKIALNILFQVVPASTEEFIEDGGPLIILDLIKRCQRNSDEYGNEIFFRSVELLSLLTYKFNGIQDSVAFHGGINCIISLCENILCTKNIEEQNQRLLCLSIGLLEQICNPVNAYDVLPLIVNYMERYTRSDILALQIPELIISCFSFIWKYCAYNHTNSQAFVKLGGLYLMLDIIEMSSFPVRLTGLGTLIDLCESIQCIPYLVTWKRNGKGIYTLLTNIFRDECKRLLTKIDQNGVILDYRFPLMGEIQYHQAYCTCHMHSGNAVVGDIFMSCRPKVYCLLQILHTKQAESVEIANEFYKVLEEGKSIQDQITLVLAENYLALKLGEEWKEIKQGFNRSKIKPIQTDEETLKTMVEITDKWAKDIQTQQYLLLKKAAIKQHQKELLLYNTLRGACIADAWNSMSEMKYIAHCTERLFRITSTFNTQSQIANSRQVPIELLQMHKTFQSNVSVTCMRNLKLLVPLHKYPSLQELPFLPVSPVSSVLSSPRQEDALEGEFMSDTNLNCANTQLN